MAPDAEQRFDFYAWLREGHSCGGFAARERSEMDRDGHDGAQFAPARANIRFMFHAMVTRLHSPRTLSSPRSRNWRNPITDLMIPNTGSGVCLRRAYCCLPFGVRRRYAMASMGVGFFGAGGAAAKRSRRD